MKDFWINCLELLPSVALAVLGGFTRTVAGKQRGEKYKWSISIPEMVVAGFVGMLIHLLLSELEFAACYKSAAVAMSGYSAREIISLLRDYFLKKIKKETM